MCLAVFAPHLTVFRSSLKRLKQLPAVPSYSTSADPEVKTVLIGFNKAVIYLEVQVMRILPMKDNGRRI